MNRGLLLALLCCISAVAIAAHPARYPRAVTSASADLNGDGKKDMVKISAITAAGSFRLSINQTSVTGRLDSKPDGFSIIDIDTNDAYKEIDVWLHGESDFDDHFLYWYDGKTIHPIGRLVRWPEYTGTGIIYVSDSMGFWIKVDKYVLDKKTHTLLFIPQEFYAVSVVTRVLKSFPIYTSRGSSGIVANLKPNSHATLLLCGKAPGAKTAGKGASEKEWYWYLIKSETDLIGWAKLPSFREKLALTWYDF